MRTQLALFTAVVMASAARAEIVFRAEPPQVPEKMPVVKVVPNALSRELMLERARMYTVTDQGEPQFIRSPRGLALQAGTELVMRDTMGTEFYADLSRFGIGEGGDAIPDATAMEIALKFLEEHPGEMDLREIRPGMVRHLMIQAGDIKDLVEPPQQAESIVQFRRFIEGVPVIGPGSMIQVHVSNRGNVTGLHRLYRTGRIMDALPTRPYEEVQKELVAMLLEQARQSDVYIDDIIVGLYARPEGQPQDYMQPAYLFRARFIDPETRQSTAASLIPMPAVDPRLLMEPLELPDDTPPDASPNKLIFRAEPPNLLPAVQAAREASRPPTEEELRRRAVVLGMDVDRVEQNLRGLVAMDTRNNLLLFQDANGAETFSRLNELFNAPPDTQAIPDGQAMEIALNWAGQMGAVDIKQLGEPMVRHIINQGSDTREPKPEEPMVNGIIVEFPQLLPAGPNNQMVPVVGEGAFFDVFLSPKGEVQGHHRVMRQTEPGEFLETMPFDTIRERFVRQMLSQMGQSAAEVVDVKFGLYSRPEGFKQELLLPAVVFTVNLIDPETGDVTAQRDIPMPASDQIQEPLEDPDAQIMPPVAENSREADAAPDLYGDLSGNGIRDTQDAIIAARMAGGLLPAGGLTPAQLAAGDVTPEGAPDNMIMLTDAVRIIRAVFGLDNLTMGP